LPSRPLSPLFPYTTLFRSSHPMTTLQNPIRRLAPQPCPELCGLQSAQDTLTRSQGRTASPTTHQGISLGHPTLLEPYVRSLHARSEEHTSELQSRFDLVCR